MTTLLGLSIAESTFNIVFLSYSDFLNMASANDILSVETRFIASLIYRVFDLSRFYTAQRVIKQPRENRRDKSRLYVINVSVFRGQTTN